MCMTDLTRPASPLGEERVSQEVAEAKQAKDLADKLEEGWRLRNSGFHLQLPREMTVGVVADALKLYYGRDRMHGHAEIMYTDSGLFIRLFYSKPW